MASQPRRSSLPFLVSVIRSGGTYLVASLRGNLRAHALIASAILLTEVVGLLFRVPGLGWWGRIGILYGIICALGALVFLAEMRRMRAAVVFARREREARRQMELPEDF